MQVQEAENKADPVLAVQVFTQWTPNPNAYKFITSDFVISSGKASYADPAATAHIPLVQAILEVASVTQVHLYENVITVTQDGSRDWGELAEEVEAVIVRLLPSHDIDFPRAVGKSRDGLPPDIQKIEDILDRTIRPGLQGDGGDVEVVELDGNILTVRYEGACGTCPSSMAGTLQAITGFLREEFHPEIEVVAL